MPFIDLTINAGSTPICLNTETILYVEPNGSRSKINFVTGGHLHVSESYEVVQARLTPAPRVPTTPGDEAADAGATADAAHPATKRQTK